MSSDEKESRIRLPSFVEYCPSCGRSLSPIVSCSCHIPPADPPSKSVSLFRLFLPIERRFGNVTYRYETEEDADNHLKEEARVLKRK